MTRTLDYRITYTDHRRDEQEVRCSAFEDAEKIAKFLADLYGHVCLVDGELLWVYHHDREEVRGTDH
jgi:hypothetical protein